MKKFLLVILAFLFAPFFAQAQVPERIIDYTVTATINTDSTVHVKEAIQYDFGAVDHHGIFRIIPYRYKSNVGNVTVPIADIKVWQDGQSALFSTSKQSGTVEIKIGDPDTTITGQHLYTLEYEVSRAMGYFADHDELYWNAIGTSWQVPILRSNVFVVLPEGVKTEQVRTDCFAGPQGSTESNCQVDTGRVEEGTLRPMVLFASKTNSLNPQEGLTFVVGFPKGIVHEPSKGELWWQRFSDNWVIIIPILIFILMFFLWRKFGKDPKGRGTIVPEYDPPQGMTPIEVGTLVDGKLDKKDISAEVIYLAEQGYITIKQVETKTLLIFKGTDYELTKVKEVGDALSEVDQDLMVAFFPDSTTVKLSDLKNDTRFYTAFTKATEKVYKNLVKQGYFRANPRTVKGLLVVLAIFVGFGVTILSSAVYGIVGFLSGFATGLILLIFGIIMPSRTKKGSEARDHILGLKLYMNVAEKDRIAFHNAPEKTPQRFEKLLPFAMALGVEKAWAKQFEGIYNQNPGWYSGVHPGVFAVGAFTDSMSSFSDSVRSTVVANASHSSGGGFGGGGFSGGGGGGGGGGSW